MENQKEKEQWLPIPGYEGFYEVSNLGRVKSLAREVPAKGGGVQMTKEAIMSFTSHKAGYHQVSLRRDGERKKELVHRLVLLVFSGYPEENQEGRHLNDVKTDNRLENLRWGSRTENLMDRQANGIDYYRNLTHCPLGHSLEGDNLMPSQIKRAGKTRSCLACNRARSNLKANPDYAPYLKEVGDIHLENLLGPKKRLYRRDIVNMLNSRGIDITSTPRR